MDQGIPLTADSRSKHAKRLYGGFLLVVAIGCGFLATWYGFLPGLAAAIFGVCAVSMLAASFGYAGKGPCPTCGNELTDLPREREAAGCAACGSFALVRDARLLPTPPDHVTRRPGYEIKLEPGQQPDFHGLCAACGQQATVTKAWELRRTIVGAPGIGQVIKKWTIGVAACPEHVAAEGVPTGVSSFDGNLAISSHRTWRAVSGRA